jgi:hypothetical protein
MEGLGFWIFVGLFMVAVITAGSREKIEKQRTLQKLLERNEPIDEELVNRLIGIPGLSRPGAAWRALRVVGVFLMVVAIPTGIVSAMIRVAEGASVNTSALFGAVISLLPLIVGVGLFVASRFCEKPSQDSGRA